MSTDQSKNTKRAARRRAERPSALAMFTAAGASAAAFMVITKSGIAGTLMGAAVFSAVYHGASLGIGQAFERLVTWWLERRGIEVSGRDEDEGAPMPASVEAPSPLAGSRGVRTRRALAVWAPLVLALAAFGASGYSLATGTPIETVVIRERVVEKPVVQERVVVQKETVTVTVTVPSGSDSGGDTVPVPTSTTTATTTSTTVPDLSTSTVDTTVGDGGDGATGSSSTTTVTTTPTPPTTAGS